MLFSRFRLSSKFKTQSKSSNFLQIHKIRRFFTIINPEINNDSNKKLAELKLPPDLENQFNESLIGKFANTLNQKNLTEGFKSIFMFRNFLIPNYKKQPEVANVIKKMYFYLFMSRVF